MSKPVKCDSCKTNFCNSCCDKCSDTLCECYFMNREYISHMDIHYNDPNLYITCIMCKVNQYISGFKFKNFKCRLCAYVHRYRYTRTKDRFREYAEKLKIKV